MDVCVSVSVSVDWARTLDDSENEWVIAEEHVDAIDQGAISVVVVVVVVVVVEEEEEGRRRRRRGARAAEGRPERKGRREAKR